MILLKTFLLVYFQYLCLLELLAFAYLLILSGLKVKRYLKNNILITKIINKIVIKNYHFKTKNNRPSHIIYLKDFKLSNLKITKINCADRLIYFIDYF